MYFSIDSLSLSNTLSNKTHQINESSGGTSSFNSKILLIKPKVIIDSKPLAKYNIKHYKQCNGCSMTHNHMSVLKKIGNFSSEWINILFYFFLRFMSMKRLYFWVFEYIFKPYFV